jgi:polyphosphate kinase
VAPVNLREQFLSFIERETEYGKKGHIILKANSLVDAPTIRALYRASQAGVKVDLIIRGICGLRPGLPDISENIRVFSIVGRYLEHTRIYYFGNNGDPEMYIGSADLMPRNIDRRVEVLFPIEDAQLRDDILEYVLKIYLQDTAKAYVLQANGEYIPRYTLVDDGVPLFNSQTWLMENNFAPLE